MIGRKFDLNNLRVASPCPTSWDAMAGDEKTRFCNLCSLNVYNISEMTGEEVRALVEKTDGRICGRIYKRADGTVITKDCPVGLRAYYKRTARFAGAALATIIGLFSFGFGQKDSKKAKVCKAPNQVLRMESQSADVVEGTITDPNCDVIPGATITLISKDTKREVKATSDENGRYQVLLIAPGRYTYRVESSGFKTYVKNLEINKNESFQINVSLSVGFLMGVIVESDTRVTVDLKSTSNTFRITREMMDNLPH